MRLGALAGYLAATVKPKRKTLMADIILPKGRNFVLGSKSHISVNNETTEQPTVKHE